MKTGLRYALARGYDWLWILDADSVPRPDALELLARLVEEDDNGNLGAVCASHNLLALGQMLRGRVLTPGGPRLPPPSHDGKTVECDSIIWSGALINLAVVGKVGLPRAGKTGCWEDLSLDYGDIEYAYRISRAGYRIIVHCDSISITRSAAACTAASWDGTYTARTIRHSGAIYISGTSCSSG